MSSPQPDPNPYQRNDGFSRDQTLFLINLMRHYITAEGDSLPKNLREMNARLRHARANKKTLWDEVTEKLGGHFQRSFCPVKVARKWNTLVEGYRKVKDSRGRTGKGIVRFKFYTEMDNLVGVEHDVVYPVIVGEPGELEVRGPAREACLDVSSSPAGDRDGTPATTARSAAPASHKRRRLDDDVMDLLRQSEAASQRRHEEMLAQLRSTQQCFELLVTKLLDKL